MKEFCNRYEVSDLVPAVEVVGVADWYEDGLLDLLKKVKELQKLVEEKCVPTVL